MATDNDFHDVNDICKMPFPYKLYQMLSDAEENDFQGIVSWNATGTSFKVHDSVAFTKTIIPKYFKQTRYKSFQRQLCLYGFDRVLTGNQKGSRYHKKFVRGNYELMTEIKYCVGMKAKQAIQQQQVSTKHSEQEPTSKKNQESLEIRPEKPVPVPTQCNSSSPSKKLTLPLVPCQDSPKHSTATSPTLEQETRIISPSLSPVSSSNEMLPFLDSMSPEDLDDFSLFEGRVFQSFDPSSWQAAGDKVDHAHPGAPHSIPTTIALSPVGSFSPSDAPSCSMLSAASTQELYDAWQQGYEHALSFPLPKKSS